MNLLYLIVFRNGIKYKRAQQSFIAWQRQGATVYSIVHA